jgi:hypothetical protein
VPAREIVRERPRVRPAIEVARRGDQAYEPGARVAFEGPDALDGRRRRRAGVKAVHAFRRQERDLVVEECGRGTRDQLGVGLVAHREPDRVHRL